MSRKLYAVERNDRRSETEDRPFSFTGTPRRCRHLGQDDRLWILTHFAGGELGILFNGTACSGAGDS
ncbi:MAG: hypothetical protein WCC39_16365 [Telluria sp.]